MTKSYGGDKIRAYIMRRNPQLCPVHKFLTLFRRNFLKLICCIGDYRS
ncbi:hypothetical protein BLIJ_1061 [Bifidobacterium longum subsp. infantis ATCC 15697 = JCM 1222 = DSM 20088]|nr:hypothetical protein BLIJ_1061 [Bifidobacterium longum subsp. infantis ATCC 15697 = JCM 1222 = DSM 20088]